MTAEIIEELKTYLEQSLLCRSHRSKCTLSETEREDRSAPSETQNTTEESSVPPDHEAWNRTDTANKSLDMSVRVYTCIHILFKCDLLQIIINYPSGSQSFIITPS